MVIGWLGSLTYPRDGRENRPEHMERPITHVNATNVLCQ